MRQKEASLKNSPSGPSDRNSNALPFSSPLRVPSHPFPRFSLSFLLAISTSGPRASYAPLGRHDYDVTLIRYRDNERLREIKSKAQIKHVCYIRIYTYIARTHTHRRARMQRAHSRAHRYTLFTHAYIIHGHAAVHASNVVIHEEGGVKKKVIYERVLLYP